MPHVVILNVLSLHYTASLSLTIKTATAEIGGGLCQFVVATTELLSYHAPITKNCMAQSNHRGVPGSRGGGYLARSIML